MSMSFIKSKQSQQHTNFNLELLDITGAKVSALSELFGVELRSRATRLLSTWYLQYGVQAKSVHKSPNACGRKSFLTQSVIPGLTKCSIQITSRQCQISC